MGKRNCESCRHFADAKMARSGWCRHPEFQRDALVMVRRSEIACSKGWKKDLWEARGDAPADSTVAVSPLAPATAAEIAAAAMFAQPIRAEPAGESLDEPRDVVVGEQPSLWRAEPAPRPIDVPLSADELRVAEERGGSGTIRRAHELQRERNVGKSRYVGLPFTAEGVPARPGCEAADAREDAPWAGTDEMVSVAQSGAVPATDAPSPPVAVAGVTDPIAGAGETPAGTGDLAAIQGTPRVTFDVARGEPLASRPMRWARADGTALGDDGVAGHLPELQRDLDASHGERAVGTGAEPDPRLAGGARRSEAGERPAPVLSWRQGSAARPGGEPGPNRLGPASDDHGTGWERTESSRRIDGNAGERSGTASGTRSPVQVGERLGVRSAVPVRGAGDADPHPPGNTDPLVAVTMAERRQWRQRWQSSELVAEVTSTAPLDLRQSPGPVDRPDDDRRVAARHPGNSMAQSPLHGRATEGSTPEASPTVSLPERPARVSQARVLPLAPEVSPDSTDLIDLPLVSPRSHDPRHTSGSHDPIRITGQGQQSQEVDRDVATRWADRIANVPRTCATCRDFRPAESGERGWCTNTYAFTHRRMVAADERPCESIIGSWWLPHDMVWLGTDDIQAHGLPTPLVDTLLTATSVERLKG